MMRNILVSFVLAGHGLASFAGEPLEGVWLTCIPQIGRTPYSLELAAQCEAFVQKLEEKKMKSLSEIFCLVLMAFASASACAGEQKTYESMCGAAKFRVVSQNDGHLLANKFTLSAMTASGPKTLFIGDEGGWFHAACLPAKDGRPLLVFQSYCGGSVCREGKYGAVDPRSLAVLLRPSPKNVENDKALARLLGSVPPHLESLPGSFCCSAK